MEGPEEQEWPSSDPTSSEWQVVGEDFVRPAWREEGAAVAVEVLFDPAGWSEAAAEGVQAGQGMRAEDG